VGDHVVELARDPAAYLLGRRAGTLLAVALERLGLLAQGAV
jgi:hypothetical protein